MSHIIVISEIGINHGGDINKAHALIEIAAEAGAEIIKFQTVNADEVYKKDDKYYSIFKQAEFNRKQWVELKRHVESLKKGFLSTPGDLKSLELLVDIGVSAIKVASDSADNIRFVNTVLKCGKWTIISMGHMKTVEEMITLFNSYETYPQTVMYCVSKYPTPPSEANLSNIMDWKIAIEGENFKRTTIGYSDHVPGIVSAITASALGAEFIEKHIKLTDHDIDAPVSLFGYEFKVMVDQIRIVEKLL